MKILANLFALCALALPSAAGACEVLLSCHTVSNKRIHVCQDKQGVQYQYGPPSKPELRMHVPCSSIMQQRWKGENLQVFERLRLNTSKVIAYTVYQSTDLGMDPSKSVQAGVEVSVGQTHKTISCDLSLPHARQLHAFKYPK